MKIIRCIKRVDSGLFDKNGTPYIRLEFKNYNHEQMIDPVTGEIIQVEIPGEKTGILIQYKESYTSTGRADTLVDCQEGSYIAGEVVSRKVLPYTTEKGKTLDYYTLVVTGDSRNPDWEHKIEQAFQRANKVLIPTEPMPSHFQIVDIKEATELVEAEAEAVL